MATGIRVGIVDADASIRAGRRMVLDAALDISVVFEEDDVARVMEKFDDYLIDVLLVEQRLRGVTGVELTQALTKIKIASGNATRILLTTVFSSPELCLSAFAAGASALVEQSEGPQHLLDQIRLLNSARPAHSSAELQSMWQAAGGVVREDLALELFLERLPANEIKGLQMLVSGAPGAAIAKELDLAIYRVRKNLERALSALGLATLEQLQIRFISAGIANA